MPGLIDFYEKHKSKRNKFEIIAIHSNHAKTFAELDPRMKKFIAGPWKGNALPFPLLLDSTGKTFRNYGVASALPVMVLIDPEGNVVRGGNDETLLKKLEGN